MMSYAHLATSVATKFCRTIKNMRLNEISKIGHNLYTNMTNHSYLCHINFIS